MEPADRQRLLDAWDVGVADAAPQRARAILRAFGAAGDDEIAAMTLGERDRILLQVRGRLFGDRLAAIVNCPSCREQLELLVDARELAGEAPASRGSPITVRTADEIVITARPPSAGDLELASRATDARSAQVFLLQRCIERASRAGHPIPIEELPAPAVEALGEALEIVDPQAHIELDARCAGCGHTSRHTLDVAAFLWAEIDAEALRLLHDVHRLGRGYGWRESDVLALSTVRRRAYLAMLPA